MNLSSIGYRPVVEASFCALEAEARASGATREARASGATREAREPGRVARAAGDRAHVWTAYGERVLLVPRRLREEAGDMVAGDWVAWHPGRGAVEAVLPRFSFFARRRPGRAEAAQVVAANVDLAVVVMALDADFSARRLSRYLALAHGHGVEACVLLTKAGLAGDVEARVLEARRAARSVPVHAVDVVAGVGLAAVSALPEEGRTLALLGSSGVGKSTLVNHWLGADEHVRTAATRANDGTGRHTTTHRELHLLPGGGIVLDTPGMREVGLLGGDDGIERTFDDVAEVARGCRFRDCRHQGEPGCAVALAIEDGGLDAERVAEAQGLNRERSRAERRAWERDLKTKSRQASRALRDVLLRKGRI